MGGHASDRSASSAGGAAAPVRPGPAGPVAALLLAGAVVVGIGLAAYASRGDPARPGAGAELRGTVLPEPASKPGFTLTDTEGRPFDFRAETDGRLVLLFFGYTHCPDICPVHLVNLAAVLRDLSPASRGRIRVVFVSADPARDTPERIREWLDAFDPRFTGLRGSLDEVNRILSEVRLAPVIHGPPGAEGSYVVGHPAHVLAFTPDDSLRVLYPFGTRQADWAHDLPRLLAYGRGDPGGAARVDEAGVDEAGVEAPHRHGDP